MEDGWRKEGGRRSLGGWKSQRKIVTDSLATHTTERAQTRESSERRGEKEREAKGRTRVITKESRNLAP